MKLLLFVLWWLIIFFFSSILKAPLPHLNLDLELGYNQLVLTILHHLPQCSSNQFQSINHLIRRHRCWQDPEMLVNWNSHNHHFCCPSFTMILIDIKERLSKLFQNVVNRYCCWCRSYSHKRRGVATNCTSWGSFFWICTELWAWEESYKWWWHEGFICIGFSRMSNFLSLCLFTISRNMHNAISKKQDLSPTVALYQPHERLKNKKKDCFPTKATGCILELRWEFSTTKWPKQISFFHKLGTWLESQSKYNLMVTFLLCLLAAVDICKLLNFCVSIFFW